MEKPKLSKMYIFMNMLYELKKQKKFIALFKILDSGYLCVLLFLH